ncbi:MAG: HIT family protein [Bacilli bacterium]|nr:HIT family protein [Bacilli bacterium]
MLYEDDVLYCFFEENPRSIGHTIILLKERFNDMSFISDDVCAKVYVFAKRMMDILKETLEAERIYLCTMCDGEVNHFHLQLLPRYPGEVIGSTNFVRERKPYVENKNMVK